MPRYHVYTESCMQMRTVDQSRDNAHVCSQKFACSPGSYSVLSQKKCESRRRLALPNTSFHVKYIKSCQLYHSFETELKSISNNAESSQVGANLLYTSMHLRCSICSVMMTRMDPLLNDDWLVMDAALAIAGNYTILQRICN